MVESPRRITFDDAPPSQTQDALDASSASNPRRITFDDVPESEPPPQVGGWEAAGRGAAQGLALGYSPQIIAGFKTGNFPGSSNPEYLKELSAQKAATDQAWEQHPYYYGTGMAASAIPAVIGAVAAAPEEAAVGAGAGLWSLLSDTANVGSLGARALRGAAGASEGVAPSLARGAANVIANPVVQGGIYGSSQGNTTSERLQNAAEGAAGAKVAPALLGLAGKAIKGTANAVVSPFIRSIAGTPSEAEIAANAANALGISLPAASVSANPFTSLGAKADIFNRVKNASANTLGQAENIVTNIHGDTLPVDAGNAIRNSFINDWMLGKGPNSLPTQLESIYAPINSLNASTQRHGITEIQNAIQDIRTTPAYAVSDRIDPTLSILNRALSHAESEGGLTFSEMKALRQEISNNINFNQMPGSANLDEKVLRRLRAATTQDMYAAAESTGPDMLGKLKSSDNQANGLYTLSEVLAKKLGGSNPSAPGAPAGSSIFNNVASLASRAKGDSAILSQIKQVVSPEAWNTFSQGLLARQIPSGQSGQFTFNKFLKGYNSMTPEARDIVFGKIGSSETRDTLEHLSTLGKTAGTKLDLYGLSPEAQSPYSSGQMMGAGVETVINSGFPVKALTAIAGTSALGGFGARNVASALPPPTERAKLFQYLSKNPESQGVFTKIHDLMVDPALNATAAGQKIIETAIQKTAGTLGAQAGIQLAPEAIKAIAMGAYLAASKYMGRSDGGRIDRKSGGKVSNDAAHNHLVARLMSLAEKAKRGENATTKPLLNAPDEAIVKALGIANAAI